MHIRPLKALVLYKKPFLLTLFRGINAAALFIYGVLIARGLGPSGFGTYSYLIVVILLGGTIADFGMDRVLILEISRDLYSWQRRWIAAVIVRSLIALGILTFSFSIGGVIGLIGGLSVLLGTLARSMESVLMAHERVILVGASVLIQGITQAVTGLILLKNGSGITGLIVGLLISQIIYLIVLSLSLPGPISPSPLHINDIKPLLLQSCPYLLVALLALIYARVDLIIITYWLGEKATGHYSAAYRFLDAAGLFPAALAVTQTPIFARLDQDGANLRDRYKNIILSCSFLGGVTAISLLIAAKPLIYFLYGPAFAPASDVLRVLSLAAFFIFIHSANVSVAFSINNGQAVAWWSLVTAGINLCFNLLLIPTIGIVGAAWATVIGEAASFVLFYRFLQPYILERASILKIKT